MWIAKFVVCTMVEGCMPVRFEDQYPFYRQQDCEIYTELKSDLFVSKMNEYGLTGVIYYDCVEETPTELKEVDRTKVAH
jgi:hypothetical protein